MEPVKHIAQFIWMGWYIGGVAMGAFVWQSQSLGLVLGALAVLLSLVIGKGIHMADEMEQPERECTCTWDSYERTCVRPFHVAAAMRQPPVAETRRAFDDIVRNLP